jgi:hypothetical protein
MAKSKGATGASIRKHPQKAEIDERLLAGESVEAVEKWLKQKNARNKRLQVNKMTLQAYRRNFLNLDGDVLADLKRERSKRLAEERKRRALEAVQAEPAYQLAKKRYAESYALQIHDTNNRLDEIYTRVNERIAIMEGEKIHHLNEKVIVEQFRMLKDLLKDAFEMEQRLKEDQQTNINIDVSRMTREVQLIKTTLQETITELCPDIWPVFMETLREKMEKARLTLEEEITELDGHVNISIQA